MTIGPFKNEWKFLSNFYPEPKRLFLSNEHFYQAEKTTNKRDRALIMSCKTAGEAKRLGADLELRHDWLEVRRSVMLSGLRNKFILDHTLGNMLLATGEEHIEEINTWGDQYWGTCNGFGENHLGQLLMEVRSELRFARAIRARSEK